MDTHATLRVTNENLANKLINYWESLRANFWFVPTVLVAGAVALSLVMINLDKASAYDNWMATLGWFFTRGPEGSRAVLSTVAGSMMTITRVTFSSTIVALQLASSQFGPRLLRNFMRDRGSLVLLGTFIATFAHCLLALRTVNGTEEQRFVPHLSVTVGLLMALCRYDDEGRLRVVADALTTGAIVNASFDQVRQAARNDAAVTIRLLETIAVVAAQARGEAWHAALRRQAEMVHRGSQQALPEEGDRSAADDRLRDVLRALGSEGAPGDA